MQYMSFNSIKTWNELKDATKEITHFKSNNILPTKEITHFKHNGYNTCHWIPNLIFCANQNGRTKEITHFKQNDGESHLKAWKQFKEMEKVCLHHGMKKMAHSS